MNGAFAALMAQVIPVVALALVVQAQAQIPDQLRLATRERPAQTPEQDDFNYAVGGMIHAAYQAIFAGRLLRVAIRHSIVLMALGISEAMCVFVVGGTSLPRWSTAWVATSVIFSFGALTVSPVFEYLSGPAAVAVRRLGQKPENPHERSARLVGIVVTTVASAAAAATMYGAFVIVMWIMQA